MASVDIAVPVKTQEPNQYWEHVKSGDRVYFIGRTPDGEMVWQCEGDTVEIGNLDWSGWRHIPGCTGWDWEPDQVEEYPQYWTSPAVGSTAAFVKRVSKTECVTVMPSGTYGPMLNWEHSFPEQRTRLTEQEALALLDKSDKRAEVAQNTIERIKRFDPASVHVQESASKFPAYYIHADPSHKWYVRATTRESLPDVHLADGSVVRSQADWDEIDSFVNSGAWLEVTEAEAIARIAVDKAPAEVWPKYYVGYQWNDKDAYIRYDGPESSGVWVNWHGTETVFAGDHYSEVAESVESGSWRQVTEAEAKARVTKAIEPEMEWVDLPGYHVLRKDVDWVRTIGSWEPVLGLAGKAVQDLPLRFARCRRKDLPVVESPEDWVTQDRVEARPGIDQGWWSYAEPNVDKSKWSWWPIANSGSAIGRKHGHVHEDGQMLNLRCKRKDLPPVPAPVEETFPQWYILKDDEKRSWVPDWTVKRTGEETSIRYARDEAGELYATNEQWTGAAECWQRCSALEAYDRLGTRILPDVPSEQRRVPVKLWVTHRLADEGGDWPVRATQSDQTCQNWKEIKFDGNGAFIELES